MVEMRGVDLRCGAGRVAALRRPRRLIHSRSRSTPQNNQNKQPTLTGGLPVLVEMRGVDLRCGAGRLGLRHAPGMSPRALGFNSPDMQKENPP